MKIQILIATIGKMFGKKVRFIMQTQQIKNFFPALIIVVFCAGGFYLWKHEQEKALTLKIAKEKRVRLDEDYIWKFFDLYRRMARVNYYDIYGIFDKEEAEIKKDMRLDGYNGAETSDIFGKAMEKLMDAEQRIAERKEKQDKEERKKAAFAKMEREKEAALDKFIEERRERVEQEEKKRAEQYLMNLGWNGK
jgi:hypothetical protein